MPNLMEICGKTIKVIAKKHLAFLWTWCIRVRTHGYWLTLQLSSLSYILGSVPVDSLNVINCESVFVTGIVFICWYYVTVCSYKKGKVCHPAVGLSLSVTDEMVIVLHLIGPEPANVMAVGRRG